ITSARRCIVAYGETIKYSPWCKYTRRISVGNNGTEQCTRCRSHIHYAIADGDMVAGIQHMNRDETGGAGKHIDVQVVDSEILYTIETDNVTVGIRACLDDRRTRTHRF